MPGAGALIAVMERWFGGMPPVEQVEGHVGCTGVGTAGETTMGTGVGCKAVEGAKDVAVNWSWAVKARRTKGPWRLKVSEFQVPVSLV